MNMAILRRIAPPCRRLLLLCAAVALPATGCGPHGVVPPPVTAYVVGAGWEDPGEPALDYQAFYPSELSVHAGDVITFTGASVALGHTVTFGIGSAPPAVFLPGRGPAPVTALPCATTKDVSASTTTCPDPPAGSPSALPGYDGHGFYNTGLIGSRPLPVTSATIHVAGSTAPGDYRFICLLHPSMVGVVHVVAANQAGSDQPTLDAAARTQEQRDAAAARQLRTGLVPPPGGTFAAGAFAGEPREVSLNAFFPAHVTVHAGTTVVWSATTSEPHNIDFGRRVSVLDPAQATVAFGPPTVRPGSDYTAGEDVYSGIIGGDAPSRTFALRFPTPGSYVFVCTFHLGMAGAITVTP
jgi:plastocyanin